MLISCAAMGIFIIVALLAPWIAPYDSERTVAGALQDPSWDHLCGTDEFGRDILSRVLVGARLSVGMALGTAIVAGAAGTMIGLYSGAVGGSRDSLLMRVTDFLLGFPSLVFAMIVVALLGASSFTPLFAAIFVSVPIFARVVRGATLAERSKEYVLAARALGASRLRLLFGTLLPVVLAVVLVQAAIAGAAAVQLEAALSFIGLGVPSPAPSLGSMLFSARSYLYDAPLYSVFPGVVLTALVASLIVLANALEPRQIATLHGTPSSDTED